MTTGSAVIGPGDMLRTGSNARSADVDDEGAINSDGIANTFNFVLLAPPRLEIL